MDTVTQILKQYEGKPGGASRLAKIILAGREVTGGDAGTILGTNSMKGGQALAALARHVELKKTHIGANAIVWGMARRRNG